MLIRPEQEALIGQVFESYLTQHHQEDILQLIAVTNEESHCPIFVNAMTLFETNMEVADYFNAYPHDVLTIFDKVLHKTALKFSEKTFPKPSNHNIMRRCPHTRITGLPVCPELTREVIPRSRDVGRFLSVTGTVIRTSATKVLEYEREYICTRCHYVVTMQADFEQFYSFTQQMICPNPIGCNSNKFSSLNRDSEPAVCKDYQEIKIQEQVQRLSVGNVPRSMVVVLEDDLVDSCKSGENCKRYIYQGLRVPVKGDDVTVFGVICQRWKPFYNGTPCYVELVLKANNIEVTNRNDQQTSCLAIKDLQKEYDDFWKSYKHFPIAGRNCILLSLCPQIFGMYIIKLAVAMVLAGGVQRIDSSGTKVRGECHMLLIGDPGTGKSQFLKYAAKIVPRSILTTGIGSTSAGLTVAAVKDGNDWHLEAGALVLADGGLCCIDEFNSIKEHERISIHEAMEQQSISVAKAGIVCKLNTRTSILAATNPKGRLNPNEPLSVGVALASPLLSRFDLVLVLMDNKNPEWDRIISSFILEDRELSSDSADLWTMDKMKAYFNVIKQLQPLMSEDANSILTRYYQLQRQNEGRNAARTTIRMLESLSRLAEAHSRLMYREIVTIEDAVMAVSVMECSMQGGTLLGNTNALFMPFPADPFEQYKTQCQTLLEELKLPAILQKELGRLERLRTNASDISPPSDKCQPRGPTMTTRPYHHDISSQDQEDSLDSFHSYTPSLLADHMNLPLDSPTHNPVEKNTDFLCLAANNPFKGQNMKNISSYSDSTSIRSTDILIHPCAAFLSPSEDQTIGKEGKMRGDLSRTQEHIEQEKKHTGSESVSCVIPTIPKNVGDRNFKEQKQQQQCDTEQRQRGNDAVSRGQKAPTDPSLLGKERTSENICTVTAPRQKMGEDLFSKLSAFKFKARKVSIYNRKSGTQQNTQSRASSGTPGMLDMGSKYQRVSSSGSKRKHSSNDSDVGHS